MQTNQMNRQSVLVVLCIVTWSSFSESRTMAIDSDGSEESCNNDQLVADLDPIALEKFVAQSDVVLVNFCTSSSGKCRLLSSEFDKAAAQSTSGARFALVDGEKHRSVGPIYGVQEFPTIRIFIDGRMLDDYTGRRVAKDISEAADKLVQDRKTTSSDNQDIVVKRLSATSFVSVTHDLGVNAFIMFEGSNSCEGFTEQLSAVARTFASFPNVTVAAINALEYPDVTEPYTRHGMPSFVFFPQADPFFGFKPQPIVYADMRTAAAMVRFINRKCRLRQPLIASPDGTEGNVAESLPGATDRDAPAWIFEPATSV